MVPSTNHTTMGSFISYLPFLVIFLVVGTTAISFYLAYFKYEHVTYFLPYISDTGTFPPESCIFGQGLNFASILVAFAIYLKYLQVEEIFHKHHIEEKYHLNKTALILGLVASVGMNLVANFQETNAFIFHWLAAILTFGGGALHLCLQSYLYVKVSPVIGQRKTTMLRIILSIFAVVSFSICTASAIVAYDAFEGDDLTKWKVEDGGYHAHQISTHAEWLCAGCIMFYVGLFYTEFKSITVKPIVVVLDEQKNTQNDVGN